MIIKLAYDSDWEDGHLYGVAANRSITGKKHLKDALLSAAHDKNVEHLEILNPKDFSGISDREEIKKFVNSYDWKNGTRFDWSAGMNKEHSIFKKEKNKHQAIMDYLFEKHGL